MKRIILGLCFFVAFTASAFGLSAPITEREQKEVEEFFNSYVQSANSYSDDFIEKYKEDAIIKRVVLKNDGGEETVVVPFDRYFEELNKGKKLAKIVRYRNSYTNRKIEKLSDDKFKLTAIRTPMRDKRGLDAYFIIERTPDGLKISEESMQTTVQKFLDEE